MKYCKNCGKELNPEWNFCPYCNRHILKEKESIQEIPLRTKVKTFVSIYLVFGVMDCITGSPWGTLFCFQSETEYFPLIAFNPFRIFFFVIFGLTIYTSIMILRFKFNIAFLCGLLIIISVFLSYTMIFNL